MTTIDTAVVAALSSQGEANDIAAKAAPTQIIQFFRSAKRSEVRSGRQGLRG